MAAGGGRGEDDPMSGDANWYPEGRRDEGSDRPAQPPSGRAPGPEWALPIIFLVSVAVLLVSIPGGLYVVDFLGRLAFPAAMLATGTGIAVVIMAPDRSLPQRTRTALRAVRVGAGVFLGLVVAFVFFVAYLIGQALSDPNTE